MRIAELVKQSGVSRTTIHYYQRLGLLPKAEKKSKNSAIYDQKHLDRLKLITRLRSEAGGAYTMDHIQAIITQLDSGSEKALTEVLSGQRSDKASTLNPGELSSRSGLPQDIINRLIRENVIRFRPGDSLYDERDVAALDAISSLLEMGIELESVIPIARVVEKLAAFEIDQYKKVRDTLTPSQRRAYLLNLQQSTDALHEYLFNRIRQHLLQRG
ncbi:MAG: MerR family transcriptional regulator [Balneolaceae bacterium]|nr:MAG: MerR family transcriptional regulator [Balneolaceae bacterium]